MPSQWPRGLRRKSAAALLLRLWDRGMDVCCECCVLSGRGLCDGLITRPEESYRLWCVIVCDLENFVNEEAPAHWGLLRPPPKLINTLSIAELLQMVCYKILSFREMYGQDEALKRIIQLSSETRKMCF